MNLTTDAELANKFGIPLTKLHELRKRHGWPCVRLGRFDIRFTDEQIAEIVAMQTQTKPAPKVEVPKVSGQTSKSASRRRSA